jgi:hypothetical protein
LIQTEQPQPQPRSSHETHPTPTNLTRRDFFQQSGKAVAASALAGIAIPHVHAAGSDTIQLAIIGSGGRGSGAIANAMEATGSITKARRHGRSV